MNIDEVGDDVRILELKLLFMFINDKFILF
jgi:hypothetical protein